MKIFQKFIKLDYKITFEFFKPLFIKLYSHLIESDKVDYFLNLELANDEKDFKETIKNKGNKRLYIAYDIDKKSIAGILLFHDKDDFVELDLLLVDEDYRKKGVCRKLVFNAISFFENIKSAVVYPFIIDNGDTLKFYESIDYKV